MRLIQTVLADVPVGGIVRAEGDWGVVCEGVKATPRYKRIVDFWWDGRHYVSSFAVVDWMKDPKP